MSMIMMLRILTDEQAAALTDETDVYEEYFGDEGPDVLDLQKSWHGLHYVLTGTAWDLGPGLANAVLGGQPFGEDIGYGPARLLPTTVVDEVAAAFAATDRTAILTRYDASAMAALELYGGSWEDDDEREWVGAYLDELIAFYARAAGHPVLAVLV